jgi:CheY-like chemotaxis protein
LTSRDKEEVMDEAQYGTAEAARKCILVVDDSPDSAKTLARMLKLEGHAGHAVYNGSSALEFVRTVRPDAVLLDLTLPDMDGTDVAAEIRASQELRSTILIAVSGYELAGPALSLFDGQVRKPADVGAILALIVKVEQSRRPERPLSA